MTNRRFFTRSIPRWHLTDEQLVEASETDGRSAHLDRCETCRARRAGLQEFLDGVRAAAIDVADGVFTEERLASQQAHILRRLEHVAHPAHVIAFPAGRLTLPGVHLVARRWVALAAAAGLMVGLVAGMAVELRPGRRSVASAGPASGATELATTRPADGAASVGLVVFSDEAFLQELESAGLGPRVPELQALDALTPQPVEVQARTVVR